METVSTPLPSRGSGIESQFLSGWRAGTVLAALLLVSALCQVDRILPFILAESIKRDLGLTDTQLGLMTGIAFARRIRPESRGLAISLFSMGIPLGAMIGFGIGGRISDAFGWRTALIGADAIGGVIPPNNPPHL